MHDETTLWKLLDGELPAAEAEALEAAAASDPALARRLEDMRALKRGVLDGAPRPSPEFAARVATAAAGLEPAPIFDLDDARRFLRRSLVAAAVLAAVGLAILAFEVIPEILDRNTTPIHADPLLGD